MKVHTEVVQNKKIVIRLIPDTQYDALLLSLFNYSSPVFELSHPEDQLLPILEGILETNLR